MAGVRPPNVTGKHFFRTWLKRGGAGGSQLSRHICKDHPAGCVVAVGGGKQTLPRQDQP
jgi:hypothetical protein